MNFTPIDFARWPRREVFAYFSRMAPTGYSLTVDLDATILRRTLKEADVKLFPRLSLAGHPEPEPARGLPSGGAGRPTGHL